MAVPTAILEAARDGDRDRVLAWLDAPDVEETRDVNAVGEGDVSLLMMIASRLDSDGRRPRPAPPERVGLEGYGVLAM